VSGPTTRVILLPGAYDTPQDFLTHGFDQFATEAGITLQTYPTDLTAVADGTLIERLHHEAIVPARAEGGDTRLLLGGISIGGLMALTYRDSHPDMVDGLVLLAPYPGNRTITRAIAEAGGLGAWEAGALAEADGELRGWRALQRLSRQRPAPVWLGYGTDDRFAGGHAQMAELLPPEQVFTAPGGHDWPTWRQLWQSMLIAGLGA
jgi:pimeloyl-ACP methyl ester carboxylesterase